VSTTTGLGRTKDIERTAGERLGVDGRKRAQNEGGSHIGDIVVPRELNAWAKVSRLLAVAGAPSMEISGFATTWTVVMPAASTNRANKNSANAPWVEAGPNNRHRPSW